MRIALYARCSTQDQSVDLQLHGLREYVEARGLELVGEFVDQGVSGSKAKRPALDQLLADAHRRRFDAVVVWKLDRLGRSLSHLIRVVPSGFLKSGCFQSIPRSRMATETPFPDEPYFKTALSVRVCWRTRSVAREIVPRAITKVTPATDVTVFPGRTRKSASQSKENKMGLLMAPD